MFIYLDVNVNYNQIITDGNNGIEHFINVAGMQ